MSRNLTFNDGLRAGRKRASRSIRRLLRLTGNTGRSWIPMGSIQICPRNVGKLDGNISLDPRGSDIWVHFRDLPDETRDALWEKHKSQLAFPAGLEDGRKAARIILRELQNLTGYDFTQAAPDLESEQARLDAAAQPRVLKCLHEFIAAGGLSDSLTAEDPS